MIDPIVAEVRRIREEHARAFDNDLDKIVEDFRRRQAECGHEIVRLPPKRLEKTALPG